MNLFNTDWFTTARSEGDSLSFGAATGGKLDMLYNNAGIGRGGPFADQPFEDVLAVVQVNFVGVLIGIHTALPLLKATPGSLCFTTSSSSAPTGLCRRPRCGGRRSPPRTPTRSSRWPGASG